MADSELAAGDVLKKLQGIHVHKATGLRNADCHSESDPYFICRIGSLGSSWSEKAKEIYDLKFISKTIPDNNDPEWDVKFEFDIDDYLDQFSSGENDLEDEGLELNLTIYDKDRMRDDELGSVTIPIPKECSGEEAFILKAYPLIGKKPRVMLQFRFICETD